MMDSIKRLLNGLHVRLKRWGKAALSAFRSIHISRENWKKMGYYAALALLLAMLGTASWVYRERGRAASDAPAEPGHAVLSVRTSEATVEPVPTEAPVVWTWPLEGEIVGEYSPNAPVWSKTLGQWQTHAALDIAGSPGEAVYACRDGAVADAWSDRLWGNTVVIEHEDGYRSTYAGLNTLQMVAVGDAVKAGQVIGSVGQSAVCEEDLGWHLHFELTRNGEPADLAELMPKETE